MTKTFCTMLATLLLAILMTNCAFADTPPAEQLSADLSSSHVEWYNPNRDASFEFTYLAAGIDAGTGYIYVEATTEVSRRVDVVGGIAIIQRWANNQWETYREFYFDVVDHYISNLSRVIYVEPGYFYRLQIVHTGEYFGELITKRSMTKSIYVN